MKSAQRCVDIAVAQYETGLQPYLDVMTAQTLLLGDEQTLVTLHVNEMTAAVELVQALGRRVGRDPAADRVGGDLERRGAEGGRGAIAKDAMRRSSTLTSAAFRSETRSPPFLRENRIYGPAGAARRSRACSSHTRRHGPLAANGSSGLARRRSIACSRR